MSEYSEKLSKFLKKESPNRFSAKELMSSLSIPEQAFYFHIKKLMRDEVKKTNKKYFVKSKEAEG